MFFFFFSSRRRHTRLQGDWSSDVCSSDLVPRAGGCAPARAGCADDRGARRFSAEVSRCDGGSGRGGRRGCAREIGRAAWRGRGEISGGGGSFKKKKKKKGRMRRCRQYIEY